METVFVRIIDRVQAINLDITGFAKCGPKEVLRADYGPDGMLVQPLVNPNDPTDIVYLPVVAATNQTH